MAILRAEDAGQSATMTHFPIGAAVRYQGALGRVVRKSPSQRLRWMRDHVAVVLDGREEVEAIHFRHLTYVAKRYETAKQWRAEKE